MPNRETVDAFVKTVLAEDYVGAIERFYTDEASMQENLGVKRIGRLVMAEHERNVLKNVERIKAALGSPVVIDGDRVVVHWLFEITLKDGKTSRLEELAHQRWDGEKIAEERFYYDPGAEKRVMMRAATLAVLACLLAAACVTAEPPAAAGFNVEWRTILPRDQAFQFPCSRTHPPGPIQDAWVPTREQVAPIDAALFAILTTAIDGWPEGPEARLAPEDYYRQYAGLVVEGRRIVSISGFHRSHVDRDPTGRSTWRSHAVSMCDGGAGYFGAFYDLETKEFFVFQFDGRTPH